MTIGKCYPINEICNKMLTLSCFHRENKGCDYMRNHLINKITEANTKNLLHGSYTTNSKKTHIHLTGISTTDLIKNRKSGNEKCC